jgi:D-alanine-D-alanine ligase-like ATP-grasp enzyme
MLGNDRAMKLLQVLGTDRPARGGAPLGRGNGRASSFVRPPGRVECDPASQAFVEYDAKDVKASMHRNPRANLKPNIYYKAQDFTLGAEWAPGCRGVRRADRHLNATAGEDSEPAVLGVSARAGATETSPAPDRTAHAGFSFDEPAAWMVEDAACDC